MYRRSPTLSSQFFYQQGASIVEYLLVVLLLGLAAVAVGRYFSPATSEYYEQKRTGALKGYYAEGFIKPTPTAAPPPPP